MKRTLSLLLALLMALGMFPVQAFADQTLPPETEEVLSAEPEDVLPPAPEQPEIPLAEPMENLPELPTTLEGETVTREQLYEGYVESLFFGAPSVPLSTGSESAGARLKGDEALAYKALVPFIKEVAAGKHASAYITLSPISLQAAVTFREPAADFNHRAVWKALWFDLPYEMYWCNTYGFSSSQYANGQLYAVVFAFAAEPKYLDKSTGKYYSLDVSKMSAAPVAASNAKAIAKKYDGMPDYDKLDGYKNEICALNTYNKESTEDDTYYERDWGPQHLIYVFDGDPSTNVVCAGYARSFQYLCDLGGLISYYVTGFIPGGHAWNIVKLSQKNYLVDVTGSEPNSWGALGDLFLVGGEGSPETGYTFTHTYGPEYTITYQYDEEMFLTWDRDVLTLSPTDYVPCNPHNYTEKVTKKPTCQSEGRKTLTCSGCGHVYTESIPKLAHTANGDGTVYQEPSGSQAGLMRYTCASCGIPFTQSFYYSENVFRIAGTERCQTARLIANAMKSHLGIGSFDAIIYANGDNFADALAGSYLAAQKQAPILLYRKSGAAQNLNYIRSNLSSDGIVYILGGSSAVPESVEEELAGWGVRVKRLSGKSRFETNIEILKEAGCTGGEILVCTGYNFADSLSASATGLPILLVRNGWDLAQVQRDYLSTLMDASFTIIGGTGAISQELEDQLMAYGQVTRISGTTRYETSAAVAERYFINPSGAVLAYGQNFPDGLCGGALAYRMGVPLILTANGKTAAAEKYTAAQDIGSGYVLGSSSLISGASARAVYHLKYNMEIQKR